MSSDKIIALVPMRHESRRIPGKNYRSFAGRPLYRHIIENLLACPLISEVVIDTDSPAIRKDAEEHFPQVKLIERPQNLKGDAVSMNEVLFYDVSQTDADYYLQTHSTNPLLSPETIGRAIKIFKENYPEHDSLFSVTRMQTRLWDRRHRAVNHDPEILLRTQDLPVIYEENSCLYIFPRTVMMARRNRIGERPLLFEIEREEAWDIDEELDFRIAEFLYREKQKN
jgi:CMP-N-acetylneuraminic acid synthetase